MATLSCLVIGAFVDSGLSLSEFQKLILKHRKTGRIIGALIPLPRLYLFAFITFSLSRITLAFKSRVISYRVLFESDFVFFSMRI